MATTDKDKIFTDEAIRDTNDHNSVVADTGEFNAETIVIYNGLDQDVTLQLQGSLDNTTWLNVGSTFDVSATSEAYQTVTDYFPFYRVVASCGIAPTTGNLDGWILKTLG